MVIFKNKSRCYLKLLMPEAIKFLGNNKSKRRKDKSSEYVPYLENNEVELVRSNVINNYYQLISRVM